MTTCYECPRKTECYTKEGLAKLKPGEPPYGGHYECGALFTDFDGARTLLLRIGDALDTIPKKHRKAIIQHIADAYGTGTYPVLSELYD